MGHVCGVERTQAVLFPQSLDEYINEDNPVRFIDAYVASLDLVELGFAHATPSLLGGRRMTRAICCACTFTATSIGCVPVGGWRRKPSAT